MVLVSHEASTVILVINNGHFCRITAILIINFLDSPSLWFVQMTVTLISRNNGHFGKNNGHFGSKTIILVHNGHFGLITVILENHNGHFGDQ